MSERDLIDELLQAKVKSQLFGGDHAPRVGRLVILDSLGSGGMGTVFSAYDPRSIKGTGVTYATSPQGADHTCGLTIRAKVDHLDPQGQVELSRNAQLNMAGYDSLGACIFAGFGFGSAPEVAPALLNARYGWDVDKTFLQALGRESLALEREFNRLAGFTRADDRLPEWMMREPLPPHNAVFDVPEDELDSIFES